MTRVNPEDRLEILNDLVLNLKRGHYRTLFRYLSMRKEEQLQAAQDSATSGEAQATMYCVLATKLYDEILSWPDEIEGALAQELSLIRDELKSKHEALKEEI